MLPLKILLFGSIIISSIIIWSSSRPESENENDHLYYKNIKVITDDSLQNLRHVLNYSTVYLRRNKLLKEVKFILVWSGITYNTLNYLKHGQRAFIENNCSSIDCYVTSNKKFFGGDLTKFHTIVFDGRLIHNRYPQYHIPYARSPHQKYVFFNSESAPNYPITTNFYNSYFNWTATFRLDSDIVFYHFFVLNMNGDIVGPKINMTWLNETDDTDVDEAFKTSAKSKKYAAAWFVSNCSPLSRRKELLNELQKELENYDLDIHVYGKCGKYRCPSTNNCYAKLKKDYYFYLSLENSYDKDYVTEKVLTAVTSDVIPIVYGAANYSQFLPPGSYINAREMTVRELASLMYQLIKKPKLYFKYFWWKKYYRYVDAVKKWVCGFCSALNGRKYEEYSSYDDFFNWWNTNL